MLKNSAGMSLYRNIREMKEITRKHSRQFLILLVIISDQTNFLSDSPPDKHVMLAISKVSTNINI